MSILKSSFTVSGWTFISRITGFIRDLVLANKLGVGAGTDAFFIALTLPNLLRRLFAEGAFNVAFLPLYTKTRNESTGEAQLFVNTTFTWLFLILVSLTILAEIFMPTVIHMLAPGFADDPEKFAQTVFFSRLTFPYLIFISLTSLLGALNNSIGKFVGFASVPVLLNFSIIGMLALFSGHHSPELVATLSIPLAGVFQLAYMYIFFKKENMVIQFGNLKNCKNLTKKLVKLFGPAALGVGILQISFMIDTILASFLYDSAISYLQYANRFYQMPLSLIGTALATVLLPHFADALSKQDHAQVKQSFQTALNGGMTLAFAATIGLVILSQNLISTLLQHGEFTAEAARLTAWAMVGYSIGLPGYILTKITSTAFFAMGDTKTPVKTAIYALIVNAIANLILMQFLGHIGIALATACSGYANAFFQWYLLQKQNDIFHEKAIFITLFKKSIPTILTMSGSLIAYQLIVPFPENILLKLVWLTGGVGLGGALFTYFNRAFFVKIMKKKFRKTPQEK